MKFIEERPDVWLLEMTRRNLTTLLDKLDDPHSNKMLGKSGEYGSYVFVKAVEDTEHYAERPPGEIYSPALRDLRDRLVKARQELINIRDREAFHTDEDRSRLSGKVEGVGLALSYVDEILREKS
jgi:hypothetical protein